MTKSDKQQTAQTQGKPVLEKNNGDNAAVDENKPGVLNKSAPVDAAADSSVDTDAGSSDQPEEIGGPKGLEPTRYGDWERKGILSDF